MHEFTLIKQVLKALEATLSDPEVARVKRIHVRAGRFAHVKQEHFQECFRLMAKHPKLKGTEVVVVSDRQTVKCTECGLVMSKNGSVCPECGSDTLIRFNGLGEFDVLVEGIETEVAPAVGINPP